MDILRRKIESLKTQNEQALLKIEKSKEEICKLDLMLNENRIREAELEETFNEFEQKSEALETQASDIQLTLLDIDKMNLQSRVTTSANLHTGASQIKLNAMRSKLDEAYQRNAILEKKLEGVDEFISCSEMELSELELQKDQFSDDIKKFDEEHARLGHEIKFKQFNKNKNDQRSVSLGKIIDTLENHLKAEQTKSITLSNTLAELEEEINSIENKVQDADLEYKTIKDDWDRAVSELGAF
ncbi:hypothetical protein MXB_4546 [Myxobolus squamalis]|nr:hypothetical protein MXB_4546 [Myxobolus squamalis]